MDHLNIAQALQIFLKPRTEVTPLLNAAVLLQVQDTEKCGHLSRRHLHHHEL